jgi:hypothetical protein
VDPERPALLRTREDRPDKLLTGRLDPSAGPAQVIAQPTNKAEQATGIVFTSLGGMAVAAGISLAAVGCSQRDNVPGMCTAGLITGTAGGLVTAGAIFLILDSLPTFQVRPLFTTASGASLSLTPTGLAGTF